MGFTHSVFKNIIFLHPENDQYDDRKQRLKTHCKKVNAKHGREPVCVQRHQPVETGKCDCQRKQQNTGSTDFLQQLGETPVIGFIHFYGHFVKFVSKISPNGKIDYLTYYEKGRIKIGSFSFHNWVAHYIIGTGPFINAAHTTNDREHKECPDPDIFNKSFRDSSYNRPPR